MNFYAHFAEKGRFLGIKSLNNEKKAVFSLWQYN
jgi:hypothetical protein